MEDEMNIAHKEAWSIENREAHGELGKELRMIGKRIIRGAVFTYYRDDKGLYWYKSSTSDWRKKGDKNKTVHDGRRNLQKLQTGQNSQCTNRNAGRTQSCIGI